jgi:hypothetical protein
MATEVHDEVLGQLTWDEAHSWWTFEVGPIGGCLVRGT